MFLVYGNLHLPFICFVKAASTETHTEKHPCNMCVMKFMFEVEFCLMSSEVNVGMLVLNMWKKFSCTITNVHKIMVR